MMSITLSSIRIAVPMVRLLIRPELQQVVAAVDVPTVVRAAATELRRLLAAYREAKDLIEIGAYVAGTSPLVDRAVALREAMDGFLRQDLQDVGSASDAWAALDRLVGGGA